VSQTITISDNQPPVIQGVPQSYTASCATFQYPAIPNTIVVTDNCATNIQLQFNESTIPGNCDGTFTIIRTWTAVDQCGNTAVANQSIAVVDNQAPVWNATPSNVQIACGSPMPAIPNLTAIDNCSTDLYIDYFEFEESTPCGAIHQRFWSATDACGNTSTRMQTITFVDAIPPVITPNGPSQISVSCQAIPVAVAPLATDNCSNVNLQLQESYLMTSCPFNLLRTWTATDSNHLDRRRSSPQFRNDA
jgi:hypothetical protein